MTMKTKATLLTMATFAALSSALMPSARAAVITLTGGDSGEGFAPLSVPVKAYNINGTTTRVIQGINFLPFDPTAPPSGVTGFAFGSAGTAPSFGSPTTNDTELTAMMASFAFLFPPSYNPMTFTFGGLIAGQTYQVDAFVLTTDANNYEEQFTFNGGQTNHFTALSTVYYDIRENVVANGSGQIIVSVSAPGTLPGLVHSRFNAIAITTVPEPGSFALLICGTLGLVGVCRCNRS
jgi:hypothetical protein